MGIGDVSVITTAVAPLMIHEGRRETFPWFFLIKTTCIQFNFHALIHNSCRRGSKKNLTSSLKYLTRWLSEYYSELLALTFLTKQRTTIFI